MTNVVNAATCTSPEPCQGSSEAINPTLRARATKPLPRSKISAEAVIAGMKRMKPYSPARSWIPNRKAKVTSTIAMETP